MVTTDDGSTQHVVEYTYNDEGIRVRAYSYDQPSGGGTKSAEKTIVYFIDAYNLTGYAQVLEELTFNKSDPDLSVDTPDSITSYIIGDDVIAQNVDGTVQYLLYDGHGSTRQLAEYDSGTDTVSLTDSFDYDGYGVLLQNNSVAQNDPGKVAPQATNLLYAGEHFDVDAQQYYLRARWYNPYTGLFNRMDPYAGSPQDPQSLHKYLYCHANPVNGIDPGGLQFSLVGLLSVNSIIAVAIGSLAPALITGYETAKGSVSIFEILKNASIAYFMSLGIGLGLVAAGPYIMAAALSTLSLIPGVSTGMAAAAIAIAFIGLTIYGAYELWTSDYPLWLKISVTAILAVSVITLLGKEGVSNLASKAKSIVKELGGGQQPPARQVSNPWGRRGSPAHKGRIEQVEQRFVDNGWETFSGGSMPEARVHMPDGRYRYPDLVMKKGNTKIAINVGHTTQGGLPVAHERAALAYLRDAGELAHAFFIGY